MLVGHVGIALIGKGLQPRLSLGTAIVAALLADLFLFAFVLLGIEHVDFRLTPAVAAYFTGTDVAFSHSLATSVLAGAAVGVIHLWRHADRPAALVLAAIVIAHWVLDVVSHRPLLPLAPGVFRYVGWNLSGMIGVSMGVEAVVWAGALALYVHDTRSVTSAGRYVFWGGVMALTFVWYANVAGRPPRSADDAPIEALILLGLAIGWGYWMNRARVMKTAS
jgi:hypothetical protein